jgi:ferredoxin-NADP reductase
MLSSKVKHFIFKAYNLPSFHYIAGQFITIHFVHKDRQLKRSYSIANVPLQNNQIELAAGFTESGPGTDLLFGLQPGDIININGPFGRLILKDNLPKRYIFLATSTGITPYRAMLTELRQRLADNPLLKVVILQGVQVVEDILYADDFNQLVSSYPNQVIFQVYLSRVTDTSNTVYRLGYVQHAFPSLALNPDNDLVYLCGNPGMVDDAFMLLKEQGFALPQIIREKYISN